MQGNEIPKSKRGMEEKVETELLLRAQHSLFVSEKYVSQY